LHATETESPEPFSSVPTFRSIAWSLTLDAKGNPARYEARAVDASGQPVLNGAAGTMEFTGDTIVRTSYRNGQMETHRIAAPNGAVPSPSIPTTIHRKTWRAFR